MNAMKIRIGQYIGLTVLALAPALAGGTPAAKAQNLTQVADSLRTALKTNKTSADSISSLLKLSDVAPRGNRVAVLDELYRTAKRANDQSVMLDALRQMSATEPKNDSLHRMLIERAQELPKSAEQRESETFINLNHSQFKVYGLSGKERSDSLHTLMQDFESDRIEDKYQRIEILFTICTFLRDSAHKPLLANFLEELKHLIDGLPQHPGALRNLYYSMASMAYSNAGTTQKALESDSVMLEIISRLEESYARQGRVHRNYDTHRYTIYQRMLGNYASLTTEQVDDLYGRLKELAARNISVDKDMRARGLTEAYHAMAHKEYARAVPLLKYSLGKSQNNVYRYPLLKMLIEATRESGNDSELLKAYEDYLPVVEFRNDSIDADYIMQYKVLLDYKTLKEENRSLDAENDRLEIEGQRKLIIFGCIIVLLVTVLAVLFLVAWRRSRAMAQRLSDSNRDLLYERDKMRRTQADLIRARDDAQVAERQKTDFINTISHEVSEPINAIVGYSQIIIDSMDDKRRKNMERFINIIEVNALLLRTLVNDVLDVAELENSQVLLKRQRVGMDSLAQVAADSMRPLLKPGVTMTCEPLTPGDADATVDVDPARLEQILGNIVSNAVKFTEEGRIDIRYGIDRKSGKPVFIVEDTGPGIPADKRESIFNRFEKLSSSSQGIGLGLYICRLVARVLDATVEVDPDYSGGTRMIITLPED